MPNSYIKIIQRILKTLTILAFLFICFLVIDEIISYGIDRIPVGDWVILILVFIGLGVFYALVNYLPPILQKQLIMNEKVKNASYLEAYSEVEKDNIQNQELWAKAFAKSGGNKEEQKSIYVELRTQQLAQDSNSPLPQTAPHIKPNKTLSLGSMIKDALYFLKSQSEDIEHYNQYSIILILLIIALLEIPNSFLFQSYHSDIATNIVISLLITFLLLLVEVKFFVYWLGRKGKKYSFATMLNFNSMLTISASIVLVVSGAITLNLDPSSWASIIITIISIAYILYFMTSVLSIATGVTKKYAFGGLLLIFGLVQIPAQLLLL